MRRAVLKINPVPPQVRVLGTQLLNLNRIQRLGKAEIVEGEKVGWAVVRRAIRHGIYG